MMNLYRLAIFFLFVVSISACSRTIHVADTRVQGYEVMDGEIHPDSAMQLIIAPYQMELTNEMKQVIGEVEERMEKRKPESKLCNWVADAIMEMASERTDRPIDVAVQNYGGIRIGSYSPGPLPKEKVFELMPFDNLISVIDVPGVWMDTLLHRFARVGGWPVSKELRFEIKDGKPHHVTISGEPFDLNKTYRVAMPDYIANGGDRMFFLADFQREDLNYLVRDALIDHVIRLTRQGKKLNSQLDGRIKNLDSNR